MMTLWLERLRRTIRRALIGFLATAAAGSVLVWVLSWTLQDQNFMWVSQVEGRFVPGYCCSALDAAEYSLGFRATEGDLSVSVKMLVEADQLRPCWQRRCGRFSVMRVWMHNPQSGWPPKPGFPQYQSLEVSIPLWALTMVLAPYPLLAFVRGPLRRVRRRRRGQCIACGYCLTGLPSRRCPECGCAFVRHAREQLAETITPVPS